jgi:hypothetical protein
MNRLAFEVDCLGGRLRSLSQSFHVPALGFLV